MTPRDLGAWWDPDDAGTDDAPDRAEAPRASRSSRTRPVAPRTARPTGPPPGAAGLTGEPAYERAPSRWWWVGVGAAGLLVLVSAAMTVRSTDLGWVALTVAAALTGAALVVAEGRRPRRVAASEAGVELATRRSSVDLRWEELRRVRTQGAVGFDHLDLHLERDTGELLRLPRRTPGGLVEAWRHRFDGARPEDTLPQVWRLPREQVHAQLGSPFVLLALGLQLPNLVGIVFELPFTWVVAAYLVVAGGFGLAMTRFPHAAAYRADTHGLTRPGWRARTTAWSDVRDVRRRGRYDPETVLELTSGEEVVVLGPDLDLVHGWWRRAKGGTPVRRAGDNPT
ncbi:hypothetical protein [Aquipuribacter sp. SD81]|uniref:hypothetical protein n=1 Tax=Aquipuribacter sp. SD81 TaxID=3127703 RepID=UPI00301AF4D1